MDPYVSDAFAALCEINYGRRPVSNCPDRRLRGLLASANAVATDFDRSTCTCLGQVFNRLLCEVADQHALDDYMAQRKKLRIQALRLVHNPTTNHWLLDVNAINVLIYKPKMPGTFEERSDALEQMWGQYPLLLLAGDNLRILAELVATAQGLYDV